MLIPRKRLMIETRDDNDYCVTKYVVYDTDNCAYVDNKAFGSYETFEECEKAIESFNSFSLVKLA